MNSDLRIPGDAPDTPCRSVSYLNSLLHLSVSDCGGECSARENALSCAYDMKDSLKGNEAFKDTLKITIMDLPEDVSGESPCLQATKSINFFGEIASSEDIPFIELFLERHNCINKNNSECNAAEAVLKKLKNFLP